MFKLIFLGKLGDVAPASLANIERPRGVRTLSDLVQWLSSEEPVLGRAMAATTTRLIVNQSVTHDHSFPLTDGDEIAFLPPMSGG
jgi:molybdopterin converting factor small subunit